MFLSTWCYLLFLSLLPTISSLPLPSAALPDDEPFQRRSVEFPIRSGRRRNNVEKRDDGFTGYAGVGDLADLFYTVSIQVGSTTTVVSLDTGSSDLWVMSDQCKTSKCLGSTSAPYVSSSAHHTGATVDLQYGDSETGTHASGPIVRDAVAFGGLKMDNQLFASIDHTNNSAVENGSAGLFGLGFPSQSFVQAAVVNHDFNNPSQTDAFVSRMASDGPLVSRLAMSGHLKYPMFTIALQRDTIDVGGNQGSVTIGDFPSGVDNSSMTWVPVRLYQPSDGGMTSPGFAPNEVYPLRWEVPLDAVFFDGQRLPDTTLTGKGVSGGLSALIDTGNSLIRGPHDIVTQILSSVSPTYAANAPSSPSSSGPRPIYPCSTPHSLSFQIGGQLFPIDPRDFLSPNSTGDAVNCVADNIVATDPPSSGTLFSWSLGDPFLKSNIVSFWFGNLTHPSLDPPRIGFMSTVPDDATKLLKGVVDGANNQGGGFFTSTVDLASPATTTINVPATSQSFTTPTSTPSSLSPGSDSNQHRLGSSQIAVPTSRPTGSVSGAQANSAPFGSSISRVVFSNGSCWLYFVFAVILVLEMCFL